MGHNDRATVRYRSWVVLVTSPVVPSSTMGTNRTVKAGTVVTVSALGCAPAGQKLSLRCTSPIVLSGSTSTEIRSCVRIRSAGMRVR